MATVKNWTSAIISAGEPRVDICIPTTRAHGTPLGTGVPAVRTHLVTNMTELLTRGGWRTQARERVCGSVGPL